jgi:hypothetical protein
VMSESSLSSATSSAERDLPPVDLLAVTSMASIIMGGIVLAAYLPKEAPLATPGVLLAAGVLLLVAALVLLRGLQDFAWDRFFLVARWAFLAYAVIAGFLEYVFVVDGTRGGTLLILTASLIVFAVDVPLILAFSVARYAEVKRPLQS